MNKHSMREAKYINIYAHKYAYGAEPELFQKGTMASPPGGEEEEK